MDKLKVLSLFSGIGSPERAITNLGIDYELIGFSEIDDYTVDSYCIIHDASKSLSLGDITKINLEDLPKDIDLITHGSPCQDYSKEGKNNGGDEGSGTRSSLMWETVEIVSKILPKYVMWENVPNVVSKKHKHNCDKYIDDLNKLGYNNYFKILNAIHSNIPQNRERVFVVSIRKDIDDKTFSFPKEKQLKLRLLDLLDSEVDESYYISKEVQELLTHHRQDNRIFIVNATKSGYLEAFHGDGIDLAYPTSKTRRGRVQPQRCHTLKTGSNLGVLLDGRIRKYTAKEAIKLMGFTEDDYNKMKEIGMTESQIYKMAGNSIVVNVVEDIFKELLHTYIK